MPIYPYVCTACGHEFDALQKISDAPLMDCPECGEPRLRKRLAAPAFQLKGTGWYETDFKNSGRKQEKEDKQKSDGKDDKKDSGSSADKDQAGSKSGSTSSSDKESKSKPAAAAGGKDS